jgi:hypothetical protein
MHVQNRRPIQIIYYHFIITNSNKYSSLLYCRNNHTFGKRVDYSVTLSIEGMHDVFLSTYLQLVLFVS